MRVSFNQAKKFFSKVANKRTALALTGVTVGVICPATAYCRSKPTTIKLPEGETWETILDKCFPSDLGEITREETRVAFKLVGFKNEF